MRVLSNTRFSDALSYMLSCKTLEKSRSAPYYGFGDALPSTTEKCLANITHYKKKFVLLLAQSGKVEQALNVLNFPVSEDIPASVLTNTGFKGQLYCESAYLHCNNLLDNVLVLL